MPTYSLVTDDRQGGWYDPGYGIRCDQTGVLINDIPFFTERAAEQAMLDLEEVE